VPTFDVVSEVDLQEVRNAVDQASREVSTRFDFKDTGSGVELGDGELLLRSSTDDRLKALVQVLEEKLVKRSVSLKALDYGPVEQGAKGSVRRTAKINAGIADAKARSSTSSSRTWASRVSRRRPRATSCASQARRRTTCKP